MSGKDAAGLEADLPMEGFEAGDGDDGMAELEAMKARLADMEAEAVKLKAMQERAHAESGLGPSSGEGATDEPAASSNAELASKEEADARSVYVGNVDYAVTPEELQMHFQSCGTVNRVTILTDKGGNPKGFAYIEFLESDAVTNACLLDGSELHSRAIKVNPKRTNVPGMKARGRGRGRGGRGAAAMFGMPPAAFMMPWMWGGAVPFAPRGRGGRGGRGRGRGGFSPY